MMSGILTEQMHVVRSVFASECVTQRRYMLFCITPMEHRSKCKTVPQALKWTFLIINSAR